ncbi:MAG: hypothetical protein R3221_02070 [Spongiibacter sp.]|nr:hypothetical protein [Spongiibacter sp.]
MKWSKRVTAAAICALGIGGAISYASNPGERHSGLAGHSAWIYDSLNLPGKPRQLQAGYHIDAINDYNRRAGKHQRLSAVYSYHGSLEMYCPGKNAKRCKENQLILSLATPAKRGRGNSDKGSSLAHYRQGVQPQDDSHRVAAVAVIDGVVNGDYEGSLEGFNELPRHLAEGFADKVSASLCADPTIDGVQFDIEPLNLDTKNGQYYFYRRIAENFSGTRSLAGVNCKTSAHPEGRFFSVFAPVRALAPNSMSAANMAEIVNTHRNGYMIAPIYDLDGSPLGHATSVSDYLRMAMQQLSQLNDWANQAKVPFKVGIPAAASVHEYVGCNGPPCRNSKAAATSQLAYVKSVITALDSSGARDNPLFLGNAIWAWSRGISHGGASFTPQTPPEEVLDYLAKRL